MWKYNKLMIVLVIAALAACTEETVEPRFTLDTSMVNLSGGDEGYTDILLSSNADLTVTVDVESLDWLSADISRRCLTLKYSRNDSGAERKANVLVSAGELQQTVTIVQPAYIPPKVGYDVGDVVDNGKGVVYWVSPEDRNIAKAVSVNRLKGNVWSSYAGVSGAGWYVNGSENASNLKEEKYQAAFWCSSLGEGWYLPARDELVELFEIYNGTSASDATVAQPGNLTDAEKTSRAAFESMLLLASADAMNTGEDTANGDSYWTSTEADASTVWYVRFGKYLVEEISKTSTSRYTRCIKVYGDYVYGPEPERPDPELPEGGTENPGAGDNPGGTVDGTLGIGSVYKEGNVASGVVFWVSEDGSTAKIVSLDRTATHVAWSTIGTDFLGADSKEDGAANTAILKASVEADSMPVLDFCAGLGAEWYWPASKELMAIYANKSTVDSALKANGGTAMGDDQYWASTEFSMEYPLYAVHVNFSRGYEGTPADQIKKTGYTKRYGRCVRTITK